MGREGAYYHVVVAGGGDDLGCLEVVRDMTYMIN
jgi:hypothetical protein